jgi:hypothetical protein
MEDAMTNKDEETQMLSELAEKPVRWFIERPEKVERLVGWEFALPIWYWKQELVVKYLDVLRSAGLEYCDYCGQWVDAARVVRVSTHSWDPSSGTWRCCQGTCEIELLRSR